MFLVNSSAVDFTHEALRLLEAEPETAENADRLKDEKAHACLWLYICTLESNLQEVLLNFFYQINAAVLSIREFSQTLKKNRTNPNVSKHFPKKHYTLVLHFIFLCLCNRLWTQRSDCVQCRKRIKQS